MNSLEVELIENCYTRGFQLPQIKKELKAKGFYVKDHNIKMQFFY